MVQNFDTKLYKKNKNKNFLLYQLNFYHFLYPRFNLKQLFINCFKFQNHEMSGNVPDVAIAWGRTTELEETINSKEELFAQSSEELIIVNINNSINCKL